MAGNCEDLVDCGLIEAERDWITSVFKQYRVSYTRGFIPDEDPMLEFTNPYFSPWDEIFKNITHLIQCKKLREVVENMPLLDHTRLISHQERARASLVLSALGNGYVWQNGEHNPVKVIPKCLAIPWVAVAKFTGTCPVICHWDLVLNNWKIKDKTKPLNIDNVETQFLFTGFKDEFWFDGVTWQLELDAVPGIKSVVAAQKAVTDDNIELMKTCLVILRKTIERLKETLSRMLEHCRPEFFYGKIRIFLAGWKNYETFPEGLFYEGVDSKPMQFSGGSAAQSTTFQIFDAVLGVVHPKVEDGEKSFLESMLDYMPRWHREFVFYVRNGPSVRDYVQNCKCDVLKKLYNDCVESLQKFRSFHIQIVTRYIINQARKGEHSGIKMLASQGTGGTGIMPFLKGVRKETADVKISRTNETHDLCK
ncbi:indoleamine 2,3-dioxygenase 2-like [Dendronephthya gigantea]|uniref:indoleamine 2,3-dioxygenase 2-like n=1 Tax=Dendronephthya gigantea TaxID=151771 RepID=UPI00106A44B3|nr:indoleamine 2,3-dioxygenase 2-like [Dendronephthya gigantea]